MPLSFDGDPTIDALGREAAGTLPGRFSGTERYELVKKLGEGGFGAVFEVVDRRQGGRLALKILRHPQAERLYRFKREFRALAEMTHPNLVRLHDMTAAGNDVFFTMELIDGVPLLSHVLRSPARAREALRQLAAGLAALHAAKIVHRDIKPSNVMVDRAGRVVLLDFGLALDLDTGDSSDVVGTPLYMSPEQISGQPLGEASDWYAVGLLLFEALTGRLPFSGNLMQIIEAKQKQEPPPPSQFVSGVPEDLEQLCLELLRRDPAARPDGGEVLRRLEAAAPSRPEATLFVGRAAELERLHAAAAAGSSVMLVRGSSGIGKSALLRRFLDELRARRPDTVIFSGRCYERESVPYKALDAVLDALARHLKRLPEVEAAALLPRETASLKRLFPVLRQVAVFEQQGSGQADALEPGELRSRGVAALRELLARLGDRRPVVVCVDDLQWGDIDSAALLADLVRGPDAPAVFWLASFRQEEATTSPLLQKLAQLRQSVLREVDVRELALGPLAGDEVRQLAAALLDEAHGEAARAEAIAGECGGSPFFLQELARGGGGALEELLRRRTSALQGAARRILEVLAVAARPVEVEPVASAAEAGEELRDALSRLRAERFIRGREGELLECYHDRIREAVAGAVEPERLRRIHLALAAALERQGRADAAQIAEHLVEGGDAARAFGYMVLAAEGATAALAFDEAARLYRRARELLAERDLALELAFAEALSAAGHGLEAARVWLGVLDAVEEVPRLDLQRRAAEELLVSGHFEEGYAAMGAVLKHIGLSAPRSQNGALARVILGRARQALAEPRFRPEAPLADARTLMRLDTLGSLTLTAWGVDPLMAAALQAHHLRLALKCGDRARASMALMLEAAVSAVGGARSRERTHRMMDAGRALGAGQEIPSVRAAQSLIEGLVAIFEGRWLDAHDGLEVADRLCASVSALPGHGSVRVHVWCAQMVTMFWLGRTGDLLCRTQSLLRSTEERGNFVGWVWLQLLQGWALGCTGQVEAGLAASEEVRRRVPAGRFELPRWYLEFGHVQFALEQGDADEAWRRVERARRNTRFRLTGQTQRISAHWVSAAAAVARAAQNPSARPAMLAEAQRLLRRIERERAPWAAGIARGLQAGMASVEGDRDGALRLLGESEPLLEAHHLELALAAVRAVRGRLLGGGHGRALCAQAAAWTAAQRISPEALRMHAPGSWPE